MIYVPQEVLDLMPDQAILTKTVFEAPTTIRPGIVSCFQDLFEKRKDIQELRLVPMKSKEVHELYNEIKHELVPEISKLISLLPADQPGFMALNKFPYDLPPDVEQHIIWLKNNVSFNEAAKLVADELEMLGIERLVKKQKFNSNVIIFERPLGLSQQYVRGSFPFIRHMHLWAEK